MKYFKPVTSALMFTTLAFASTFAQAIPISGLFSLTDDADPSVVYATGTYTTDVYMVGDAEVDLTAFDVIDRTADLPPSFASFFGNFSIADFGTAGVSALLNPDGTVLGFVGQGTNADLSDLNLIQPNGQPLPPLNPNPTYTLENDDGALIQVTVSGLQQIPEPSAIALLGIGIAGFGLAMRRRKVAL